MRSGHFSSKDARTGSHNIVTGIYNNYPSSGGLLGGYDNSLGGVEEFAVGAVLESILSEQELTRARLDYLNIIAEFNKAQYTLKKAIGGLNEGAAAKRAK